MSDQQREERSDREPPAPDPPNELEGPEPEPPHLQRGSPHTNEPEPYDEPNPNAP